MIETEGLTKRFGDLTAVDNLTIKVRPGEIFGFLGPNGAEGRWDNREFPLDGLTDNTDFLATLRQETVQTIHTQGTTLEEIFIQVTGTALK